MKFSLIGLNKTTVIILMLISLTGCQWAARNYFLPKDNIRPAIYKVDMQRHAVMKTSDDIELVADIYSPHGIQKSPTILVRIPYSKTLSNQIKAGAIARFWASRGYTAIIQGTRGRYESGGEYYPLVYERKDGIETLNWIARQPWYNGKIGMWGGSTFGYTQWVLADQVNPGIAAFNIQICSTDFYGMFYPGGAFSLESALFWAARSNGKIDKDPSLTDLENGYKGFPLIEADDRAVGDVPFFNDWASYPVRDNYWLNIDGTDRPKQLKSPVLLMAGWFDPFLPTQLNDFVRVRKEAEPAVARNSQLIIGPWAHAESVALPGEANLEDYRKASLAPSIEWFDQHLLAENQQQSKHAPVKIFVMGSNVWRDEEEWPLSRAIQTPYYLSSRGDANSLAGAGMLTQEIPASEPYDTFIYDPLNPAPTKGGAMLGLRAGVAVQNEVERRKDVLIYTSNTLKEDIEVTGNVEVTLFVATSVSNTDFSAKLVDVYPDGKAYNVSDGILRRSYITTEAPSEITIHLWPTSMVFKTGHKLRLEISSSNYPRYDRNPNTGNNIATEEKIISAVQKVFHGASALSKLTLPIIPKLE
ncbi:MAG: CocE/NonD family hydrolase [Gallionellaceae bacterium]|nr:CocE/NonD family hydrolase [Gallionellaceae bacterium]